MESPIVTASTSSPRARMPRARRALRRAFRAPRALGALGTLAALGPLGLAGDSVAALACAGGLLLASPPCAAAPDTPASAPLTSAGTTAGAPPTPYRPSQQIQFGNAATFRSLIPSPMLDGQAAEEYNQILKGAQQANQLLAATDPRVTRVRAIAEQLIPYSLKWNDRVRGWKWEANVVRSPDIRMYCLPGGKIVIYSGMLDRLRLNDNELGMLLGHEIAHALREHARERLGEQQAAQLDAGTIPQLFGLADLGAAPLGIGSQLITMKYEHTDEIEADVIGSDIASRAGFDPRAAITLWDKIAAATRGNKEQGFIYVHPYSVARRQDIVKRLPDMLALYAKARGVGVDALPDYAGMRVGRKTARWK
jgi:Zn-dependent protease with chaperone function